MKRKNKLRLRWVLLGTMAVLLLGFGLTLYLLQREPAVWREAQQLLETKTPEAQEQLTRDLLHRLNSPGEVESKQLLDHDNKYGQGESKAAIFEDPLAKEHVDETYEMRLTNEELVLMVRTFVDEWAIQRGYEVPPSMVYPVAMVDHGKLMIAFTVKVGSWHQVFSGEVKLQFDSDGMATGQVVDLYAGSLPISVMAVGDLLHQQLPKSHAAAAERIGEWVAKLEHFEFRPTLEMQHRRRARVLGMKVGRDDLTLTMRLQDHQTYRQHNALMKAGKVAVTDSFKANHWDGSAFADVPTTTD